MCIAGSLPATLQAGNPVFRSFKTKLGEFCLLFEYVDVRWFPARHISGGNIPLEFFKLLLWNNLPNKLKINFYIITRLRKKHPEWFAEDLMKLFQLLALGKIKPEIADHLTLERAIEAHHKIEKAEIQGKIIFDVSP